MNIIQDLLDEVNADTISRFHQAASLLSAKQIAYGEAIIRKAQPAVKANTTVISDLIESVNADTISAFKAAMLNNELTAKQQDFGTDLIKKATRKPKTRKAKKSAVTFEAGQTVNTPRGDGQVIEFDGKTVKVNIDGETRMFKAAFVK